MAALSPLIMAFSLCIKRVSSSQCCGSSLIMDKQTENDILIEQKRIPNETQPIDIKHRKKRKSIDKTYEV